MWFMWDRYEVAVESNPGLQNVNISPRAFTIFLNVSAGGESE